MVDLMAAAAIAFDLEDKSSRGGRLPLVGGTLCLDFTNTVSGLHEGEHEREHLHAYAHLIAWATHAGAIEADQARLLLKRAQEDENAAARVLHRALALREVVHDIFAAIAQRAAIPERALDNFNAALADTSRHARVHMAKQRFAWGWDDLAARFDAPLWPVVRSAADLLTAGKLDRIKQCPYPHCGWLFLDFSKNKSRRWCEMSVCGNRTKARRHYMREKQMGA
jgi:predicted RNA-binding Zn ribbon-like protein